MFKKVLIANEKTRDAIRIGNIKVELETPNKPQKTVLRNVLHDSRNQQEPIFNKHNNTYNL